jgi:uncharacterized protein DUF1566/Big-like domain-containing protein/FecR-like protein
MKYILSVVLCLVVVLLIINIISEDAATPEANALVTRIEGAAYLVTKEAPAGRLISNYDSVSKDDQVKVQENSRLELRLPEGTIMRLSENAHFTMRLITFEKRTGGLTMQGFLQSGKLWAKVKKLATPGSRVEVLTNTGLTITKGTIYGVDREADEIATVKVYEGVVLAVHAPGEEPQATSRTGPPVSVNAFQKVSVTSREGVSPPRDFDPKATIDDWIRWNLQRDAREGLVSIKVMPASSTIIRGVPLQLSGTGYYSDNTVKDITWFATWISADLNIAAIDQSGVATGGKQPGTTDLSAAIVDMSGSAAISVTRELLAITVTPASRSIVNGSNQQFTATARFSDNTSRDVTSSAVWKSSDTRVAVIDAGGRATAGDKAGTAVISASLGDKSGSAPLKVRRELLSIAVLPGGATIMEGRTQQFSAIGSYSDKTTENLTSLAKWHLTDPKVAVISGAGLVTGKAEGGTATISAAFGGKIGTGTITISTRELLSLIVSPAEVMIHQMESQQFTVQGSFSDGSTQDLTASVSWTSEAPLVAPIKATGTSSGVRIGSAVINATSQGRTGSSSIRVIEREIFRPKADEKKIKQFVYWPAPRFSRTGGSHPVQGGVVVDSITGLLWTTNATTPGPPACAPGVKKTWEEALAYVACLNGNKYLSYRNWRLPSREELFSIIDYQQTIPAPGVYTHGFSYIQAFYGYDVWFLSGDGLPRYADIGRGVSLFADGSKSYYVWPVRSVK